MAAQPAQLWGQASDMDILAAASDRFPEGISVKAVEGDSVYVDRRGLTLYGMDVRAVTGRTGKPFVYCSGPCLDEWQPLLAPPGSTQAPVSPEFGGSRIAPGGEDAQKASDGGDWTVMPGPAGPQWTYKRVHLVFTRKGDRPGSTAHDGDDSYTWNTLKYVPPVPEFAAPPNVEARFIDGAYVLADTQGNLLFSPKAKSCAEPCAGWLVFASGMARRGMGEWAVRQGEDHAQWVYGGKPVYRIRSSNLADIPAEAVLLNP
ncbi:hypothetical protein D3876_06380 [Sphingomonas cavernae]|uniref:Uncharacterized protein n=2 Tax=Sphingomonas cavernae TaxID=2320861 RepID=A0A418WSP9_9SPHN|nr:hypothetical protein D3876_06380 [Sphingomonas cavernae]